MPDYSIKLNSDRTVATLVEDGRPIAAGSRESSSYAPITNDIIRVVEGLRANYPNEGGADLGKRLADLFEQHQINLALSNLTNRHAWAISTDESVRVMNAQTLAGRIMNLPLVGVESLTPNIDKIEITLDPERIKQIQDESEIVSRLLGGEHYECLGCGRITAETPGLGDECRMCGGTNFKMARQCSVCGKFPTSDTCMNCYLKTKTVDELVAEIREEL